MAETGMISFQSEASVAKITNSIPDKRRDVANIKFCDSVSVSKDKILLGSCRNRTAWEEKRAKDNKKGMAKINFLKMSIEDIIALKFI